MKKTDALRTWGILTVAVFLVLTASPVYGIEINTFGDGTSQKNLSFILDGNSSMVYVTIPRNAEITWAKLNITGYETYSEWDDTESSATYSGDCNTPTHSYDENWGTGSYLVDDPGTCTIYEDYDDISNVNYNINLASKVYAACSYGNCQHQIFLYNWTLGDWGPEINNTAACVDAGGVNIYVNETVNSAYYIETEASTENGTYTIPDATNPHMGYHIQNADQCAYIESDNEHAEFGRYAPWGAYGATFARAFIPINTTNMTGSIINATLKWRIEDDDASMGENFTAVKLYTNASFNYNTTYCMANECDCWNITEESATLITTIDLTAYSEGDWVYVDITDELNNDHSDGIMNIWINSGIETQDDRTEVEFLTVDSGSNNPEVNYTSSYQGLRIKTNYSQTAGYESRHYETEIRYSVTPYDVDIDTANEGNVDAQISGNHVTSTLKDLNITAIFEFLRYNCTADWAGESCSMPINITSLGGTMMISNLNLTGGEADPYPEIVIDASSNTGFIDDEDLVNTTINISVTDEGNGDVICNITIDDTVYENVSFNNNYTVYEIENNGTTDVTVFCINDIGFNATETESVTLYPHKYILVNEETGEEFIINMSEVNVTAISTDGFNYTFNDTQNWVYYSSTNASNTVRFTIEYSGLSGLITRDFNPSLQDLNETRVCVAPEQSHYEQVIYSRTQRRVAVYSIYADCYVLMDYTSFAYGDTMMSRAFTIPRIYNLYTWSGDSKAVLTELDGGVALEINLALVEFAKRTYSISVLSEDVSISAYTNTTFKIIYVNQREENDKITMRILNGSTVLYSYTETNNPNALTLYWNHSAYDLTDDLLTLEIIKYEDDEETGRVTRLFYSNGAVGFMNPWVAILISIILLFFSLTFVAVKYVFGYFGIITTIMGLAILTMAPANQYVILMEVIEAIMLAFIFLLFKEEGAKVR